MCRDYGVLIDQDEDEGVALRVLFVIDPEGVIRHITMNDLPIGRSVDEALRVGEALSHNAEHGKICPVNWMPGESGMIADPIGAQAYFAATA